MDNYQKDEFVMWVGLLTVVTYIFGFSLGMGSAEQKQPCARNFDSSFEGYEIQLELNDEDVTEAEKMWHPIYMLKNLFLIQGDQLSKLRQE